MSKAKIWDTAYRAGSLGSLFDWQRATITLDGCMAMATELATAGTAPINMKLALWAGVTSANMSLRFNGNAVRFLTRFLASDLPSDYAAMKQAFRDGGTHFGCMPRVYRALRNIEMLERAGKLPETPKDSWTLDEWRAWRFAIADPHSPNKLPGVGYKIASFIGLLCCPLTCPLVPVDRWVIRRLGLGSGERIPRHARGYLQIESAVHTERDNAGHATLPLAVWHWYKWSQARQAAGAELPSAQPESHVALSPRF